MQEPDGFREFVAARSRALLQAAFLLTGDEGQAQDLVQTALVKVWPHWTRVSRAGAPEAYVRRVVLTTFLSWRRRRWLGEVPIVSPLAAGSVDDFAGAVDQRHTLVRALRELPPRQRAVLMLRYFEDLTEAQTAEVLGCSIGTVKSQAFKALARLRQCPGLVDLVGEATEVRHDR